MADSLIPVPFHGTALHAVMHDGKPYVSVRSICEALSVDVQAQHRRIQRHPVLSQGVAVMATVAEDGKPREMVCLPLDLLNGWLFGITAARVRDAAKRERLVQYQRECFEVLARHFGATPVAVPQIPLPRAWLIATSAAGHSIHPVPEGSFVTSWPEIVDMLRSGPVPEEHLAALREAVALRLFVQACNEPPSAGERVATALRQARNRLSMADFHAIAKAATGELWAAALAEKNGGRPETGVLKALRR